MKIAVQFGAGNIGRGFMGQLFWESGHKTVFVEYNKELVQLLNEAGKYPLRLLDAYSKKEIDLTIDNYEAVTTEEQEKVAEIFAKADIAGTAVGVRNLEAITPLVVAGIKKRKSVNNTPVDIYLCENMYGAGEKLKNNVFKLLTPAEKEWADKNIGFVGTSVARMVPAADKRFAKEGPLFVVADSYHKLPYDKLAQRAQTPSIEGIKGVYNIKAEFARKLHTHNLGHAAMGYLGYLKGYTYVDEPFNDKFLLKIFNGALEETAQALVRKYPLDIQEDEHFEIRKDVVVRFGNPMLMDALTRVAADPIRKLGNNERIIGSAKLCKEFEISTKNIEYICGAAYCYDYPEDPSAVKLQSVIKSKGIEAAVEEISGVNSSSEFGKGIVSSYLELMEKGKKQVIIKN
jgi:mannitol-1-phosphate 5-dehydrogenase